MVVKSQNGTVNAAATWNITTTCLLQWLKKKQKAQDFPHHVVSLSLILSNLLLTRPLKSPSLSPLQVPHTKWEHLAITRNEWKGRRRCIKNTHILKWPNLSESQLSALIPVESHQRAQCHLEVRAAWANHRKCFFYSMDTVWLTALNCLTLEDWRSGWSLHFMKTASPQSNHITIQLLLQLPRHCVVNSTDSNNVWSKMIIYSIVFQLNDILENVRKLWKHEIKHETKPKKCSSPSTLWPGHCVHQLHSKKKRVIWLFH